MKLAKLVLAGAMLAVIPWLAMPSVSRAEQTMTGTVTTIDRISGTIAIRQTPSGTVGASGAAEQKFKAPTGLLESVHAGDKVTFSVTETGASKSITKIDKQ